MHPHDVLSIAFFIEIQALYTFGIDSFTDHIMYQRVRLDPRVDTPSSCYVDFRIALNKDHP